MEISKDLHPMIIDKLSQEDQIKSMRVCKKWCDYIKKKFVKTSNFLSRLEIIDLAANKQYIDVINHKKWDAALFGAAQNNDLKLAQYMLNKGANIKECINSACLYNRVGMLKFGTKNGGAIDLTHLNIACTNGSFEIVEFLVKNKLVTDLNRGLYHTCGGKRTLTSDYTELLPHANEKNYVKIIKFLIKHGANECACGKCLSKYS